MTFTHAPIRGRFDGWTPARQATFVAVPGRCRSVAEAAAAVGISARSAYRLRQWPEAAAFAAAWVAALAMPVVPIGETALSRALAGERAEIDLDGVAAIRIRPCSTRRMLRMLDRAEGFKRRQLQKLPKSGPL